MLSGFDFRLLDDNEFKEDAVREELINPLVKKLGYKAAGTFRIHYSKHITHPIVRVGSKSREITSIPDYLFSVKNKFVWLLDAKSPSENIFDNKHIEQVYFYAIHPEIRVTFYALCNGKEFAVFNVSEQDPILYFHLIELEKHWTKLEEYLSPNAFLFLKQLEQISNNINEFDYLSKRILHELPVKKQKAKRHFGVHGYFTKQSWNVVQEYIRNFTKPNDTVLDPFGGSGVTLVEALVTKRNAIHIDLNPMSVFIVKNLVSPVNIKNLLNTYEGIKIKFESSCPKTETEIKNALNKYSYPSGIGLPKGSDVAFIEELFTEQQLAQLAFLKHLISKVNDNVIRECLMLAFSSTLTKINRTYHPSKSRGVNAGNAAAFCYYRYRIAKDCANLDLISCFEAKLQKLIKAKNELQLMIDYPNIKYDVIKCSATNLPLESESVDYIYTDPPYGSKIPYLDLSVMWNGWLNLNVSKDDYNLEAIEGGKANKTSIEYSKLIESSIQEMYRVLKFNRWMSFVFAHTDPKYWHLIIDSAEKAGFEYAGAVKQGNGQKSFKKKQNPFSVLHGQLIINFRKVESPEAIQKIKLGVDIFEIIIETIESVIAQHDGATLEQINNELILKGLELGFLDILSKEYKDLTPILMQHFDYNVKTEKFYIKAQKTFKTHIPVHLRIRYFLISYLKRKRAENVNPTTDQIILDVMPLLKNGTTPENQTILNVLEAVAFKVCGNCWRIKDNEQLNYFD